MSDAVVRWRRVDSTLWRAAAGRLLLLPEASSDPVEVTGPGLALWHVLESPRSLADTVAVLADAYGVDRAQVEADIAPALERLAELGALERAV